jgi:hypothetical protein
MKKFLLLVLILSTTEVIYGQESISVEYAEIIEIPKGDEPKAYILKKLKRHEEGRIVLGKREDRDVFEANFKALLQEMTFERADSVGLFLMGTDLIYLGTYSNESSEFSGLLLYVDGTSLSIGMECQDCEDNRVVLDRRSRKFKCIDPDCTFFLSP